MVNWELDAIYSKIDYVYTNMYDVEFCLTFVKTSWRVVVMRLKVKNFIFLIKVL